MSEQPDPSRSRPALRTRRHRRRRSRLGRMSRRRSGHEDRRSGLNVLHRLNLRLRYRDRHRRGVGRLRQTDRLGRCQYGVLDRPGVPSAPQTHERLADPGHDRRTDTAPELDRRRRAGRPNPCLGLDGLHGGVNGRLGVRDGLVRLLGELRLRSLYGHVSRRCDRLVLRRRLD